MSFKGLEPISYGGKEVWPLVRKLRPDAELLLAGAHSDAIRDLDGLPGVRVVGFVDAGQVYEGTVPDFSDLRFGAGIGGRYYKCILN